MVEHEELGLQGFDFNLFDEEREGCVWDYVKYFPYLLTIMKLCPGYWEEYIYGMKNNVEKYNGRELTQ